jgi:hypothetical protein
LRCECKSNAANHNPKAIPHTRALRLTLAEIGGNEKCIGVTGTEDVDTNQFGVVIADSREMPKLD